MAPKRGKGGGGSSKGGGDGQGNSNYYYPGTIQLSPYWANLAFLVISGIALAAMLPLFILMFKIKTKKTDYNLNSQGFKILKCAIVMAAL